MVSESVFVEDLLVSGFCLGFLGLWFGSKGFLVPSESEFAGFSL